MDKKFFTEENFRFFLKDSIRKMIDFSGTAQNMELPCPPIFKPCPESEKIIKLPDWRNFPDIGRLALADAIENRKSRRNFLKKQITLEELSFLLWATQGIKEEKMPSAVTRTVPSAGCRHSFETYIVIFNVKGLEKGIYRFIPQKNGLIFESSPENLEKKLSDAAMGQNFISQGALAFVWSTIPSRMEWRYGLAGHKAILLDAGHVCQNLYLACETINSGTCAIGAYDQDLLDKLLGLDGKDEFSIYAAPVGKVKDA